MNKTHQKTLQAIFARPTRTSLEWSRIESLLVAVGCQIIEGRGSRVRFVKDNNVAAFHRPRPAKEAKPYQVEQARDFLTLIRVTP